MTTPPSQGEPRLACKYCNEGVTVRLVAGGKMFVCPVCEAKYSNCRAIRAQLEQAAKKYLRQ